MREKCANCRFFELMGSSMPKSKAAQEEGESKILFEWRSVMHQWGQCHRWVRATPNECNPVGEYYGDDKLPTVKGDMSCIAWACLPAKPWEE